MRSYAALGLPSRPMLAAALSLSWLALDGCSQHGPAATAPSLVEALPMHSQARGAAEAATLPAEVAARYANPASFRIAGKLVEREVRLGDAVKQGQVLARLDATDAEQQVHGTQAALDAAKHRLVFAQQQLDRDNAQAAQNLIASAQLEQTQDAYTAAKDAQDQAAAQWALSQNALQYTTLRAEHDGVITSENADTGQVVAAGQAVFALAWSGDTDVILDASESQLAAIHAGQLASVSFPALATKTFTARVREISPAADPASRTYRVKLSLVPPSPEVRLGMTGTAVLSPDSNADARVFVLPATALFHQGSAPAVWVVRGDSTLELRSITVSRYGDQSVTVTQGLREGEMVVLAGVHTVHAGESVRAVAPLFSATSSEPAR